MNDYVDWLKKNKITEVECMIPDNSGIPRGKILPTKKFLSSIDSGGLRLPLALFKLAVSRDVTYSIDDQILNPTDGDFILKNSNKKKTIGEIAFACYLPGQYGEIKSPLPEGVEPGLKETAFYDPQNFTYPAGAYACEVEVDPETGQVTIESFTAADDFGNIINPMIVEGQVHGGLAQGIGQALLEGCVYDEDGQLISASYMDYTMPRAADLPSFIVDHTVRTPSTDNPLGVKGCGEAGAIGSPPTVVNAVVDALRSADHDVTHIDMPLTPERVWAAMNN